MLGTPSIRPVVPAVQATPEICEFECAFACDFDCAGAKNDIQRNLEGVLQVTRICFHVSREGHSRGAVSPAS